MKSTDDEIIKWCRFSVNQALAAAKIAEEHGADIIDLNLAVL